jgi:putative ABC transport system permease protein
MSLWRDVRFAARLLTRSTKFSLAAVAVFACGIAASTTAFAVVNAMTRGLPVDAPDRIVQIGVRDAAGRPLDPSFRELEEWRAAARTFAGIGASRTAIVNLRETGRSPEPTTASYVSANAFQLLGERPLLGRDFVPEDDRPGAAAVVILGASIWRNRFNSDPSVVGRSLVANDLPVTVVGVMPDGFRFPMVSDLWLSLSAMPGYGANPDASV